MNIFKLLFSVTLLSKCVFGAWLQDYGEYRVSMTNVTYCPATTPDEVSVKLNWTKVNDMDSLGVKAEMKKQVGPVGLRFKVSRQGVSEHGYSTLVNFKTSNICDQPLGRELVKVINGLNPDCTIPQGSLSFGIPDLNQFLHEASKSERFFYGNYLCNVEVLLKNIGKCLCIKIHSVLVPLSTE